MNTAIMFAGADALDTREHRIAASRNPKVLQRLEEASAVWQAYTSDSQPLHDFLVAEDQAFHSHFAKKAICCTAVQVGLYDSVAALSFVPNFLIGCSLGDTARTVCSGACAFEEAILGIAHFGIHGESIQGGAILQLKYASPATPADLTSLKAHGLSVAVYQTPQLLLAAGPEEAVQALQEECKSNPRMRARYLYNKPLHSSWMEAAAHKVALGDRVREGMRWKIRMISTTLKRPIESAQDLHDDLAQNMTGTVYWYQSIQEAVSKFQIRKLVNIGPSRTLLAFLERTPLSNPVELVNFSVEEAV